MFNLTVSENIHSRLIVFARGYAKLSQVLIAIAGMVSANAATPVIGVQTTGCTSPSSPEATAVKITAERDGDVTRVFVENNEYSEITMTIDMSLANLEGDVTFPYTATFPARKTTAAFTLAPVECGPKWESTY